MTSHRMFRSAVLGLAGLTILVSCADQFTSSTPSSAPAWAGVTTGGPADVEACGPVKVEVAIQPSANGASSRVVGRAFPTEPAATRVGRLVDETRSLWVEGFVAANEVVSFEIRQQGPWSAELRPQSVWRGSLEGDLINVAESGSPCTRTLQLRRA